MTDRIGLMGVGHLLSYLVEGWVAGGFADRLVLGPRNAETAARLAKQHGLAVAASNEELLETCSTLIVALPPDKAISGVRGLPWREGHLVISVMAKVGLADLKAAMSPARVVRAMPTTSGSVGESATALFPDHETARAVLAPLGPVTALESEEQFAAASVFGCYYGWIMALMRDTQGWCEAAGLPPEAARALITQTLRSAATIGRDRKEESLKVLTPDMPGSFTLKGLEAMADKGGFDAFKAAWEEILKAYKV